jgi:hypothetical protein
MAQKPRSYAWARHTDASEVPLSRLSSAAREGWRYALALANDHKRCSGEPPWRRHIPPLTIEEIADDEQVSAATVRSRIARARRSLFGELSDGAIQKRVRRQRARTQRPCAHPRCEEQLPPAAAGNRHYCRHHASGNERVRRHRQKHRLPPLAAAALQMRFIQNGVQPETRTS